MKNILAGEILSMNDTQLMQRCIELAQLGLGKVSPNPMVGSVIIHGDKIIGEGYHHCFGEAHAEVNAINAVKNKDILPEATIYVSLEPCAHFGKTPPCADLIIQKKIRKVVIGCQDPFAKVNGLGIQKLRDAGVEVVVGMLETECRELNKRFFTFHQKQRPYIIIKYARTKDGFIGVNENSNTPDRHITNMMMQRLVHRWRTEEDAITAGTATIISDNPKFDSRYWKGRNPTRIVINRNARVLDIGLNVFDESQNTLKIGSELGNENWEENFLSFLHKKNIQSLIIEGGAAFISSFIEKGLWDEARILTGNKFWGGGVKEPVIRTSDFFIEKEFSVEDNQCLILRNVSANIENS